MSGAGIVPAEVEGIVSLSKLELVGFKSFMSPITLDFRAGITAILGPNGCGKTNIVDAVRWVLGEQSARQLRGTKMENVIFNGTQQHKPLGFAAVNLTINNERGQFPLDYAEIQITRKVYRSGVSEYFINKAPCRLKDIRDLFADTGTGSHSYSVIEQEMIDWVLNDLHGERRLMFEEASGIVKYRMRREEAQRKLDLTDADLVRLEDILEELRKTVRSLKYQMAKARRYQIVRDRIRGWDIIHLRRQLSGLLADRRAADAALTALLELTRTEDTSLAGLERAVEEARAAHIALERERTELQDSRYEIRRRIQSSEERIIQFTERQSQARIAIEKARREIEESEKRLAGISSRSADVGAHALETEARIGAEDTAVGELGRVYREAADRIQILNAKLIELKQTQLDFLQDRVRAKSALEHYEGLLVELDGRSAEARERVAQTERAGAALASDAERAAAACRELEARRAGLEGERIEVAGAMEEADARQRGAESLLAERRSELAAVRGTHDLLQRMRDTFEGFPGGARHLLGSGDPRVRGPLADALRVEERLRPAVEAALAGSLDGVVVGSDADALAIVRELAAARPGRARLFGGDAPRRAGAPDLPAGCAGTLASLVAADGPNRDLVEALLGEAYLFETTEAAHAFARSEAGRSAIAVTRSGVSFSRSGGIYFAGAAAEEYSLLGRTEELARAKESIARLEGEEATLVASCDGARAERERLASRSRELESSLRGLHEEQAGRNEERERVEREHAAAREKSALLMRTLDEIETSRSEILSKLEEMKLALRMQEELGTPAHGGEIESELAALQKRKDELDGVLTERKVALAQLRGAIEKDREELRGLAEMERQFAGIAADRRAEIERASGELAGLESALAAERAAVHDLLDEERGFEIRIERLAGSLAERAAAAEEAERELKTRAAERERVFEKQNETKVALSAIDARMQGLVEKANELHGADLSCYLSGSELPLTDEEAAVTREMLDRERAKFESLGPVNLAAVEEYQEKKSRLDFLEAQRADLLKAKEELGEAIAKVNGIARAQFLETYGAVRKNFQETFQILFEGGDADLSLSEATDPLEADIVITARPRGKRLQDISLLSGGERALTALALLFALYKAKPSPFCIFDEVDAPLDDANVQRFLRMLNVFKKDTQFIIITHNKRTMEAAEQLYGVTMEERGISRVVSVDFAGIEKVLKNRAAAERVIAPAPVSSAN